MISARKVWKITENNKCDTQAVKCALSSIDFYIKDNAKNNETSLCYPLHLSTSKNRLPATYAKILKILRKKGYKANIQTEFYNCRNEDDIRRHIAFRDDVSRRFGIGINDTYLYISW